MARLFPRVESAFEVADGFEPESGEFCAGDSPARTGMTVHQNWFGFIELRCLFGESRSVDVDVQGARNVTFGEFFRRADVENHRISGSAKLFVLCGFDFLEPALGSGGGRARFALFASSETHRVGQISGGAASPIVEEEISGLLEGHMMMDSDNVDP